MEKIWLLPDDLFNFLKLNMYPYNYSLSINNNKLYICKVRMPVYLSEDASIIDKREVITSNNYSIKFLNINDNSQDNFNKCLFVRDNETIVLDKTTMDIDTNFIYIKNIDNDNEICKIDVF